MGMYMVSICDLNFKKQVVIEKVTLKNLTKNNCKRKQKRLRTSCLSHSL